MEREAFLNGLWTTIVNEFSAGNLERARELDALYELIEELPTDLYSRIFNVTVKEPA